MDELLPYYERELGFIRRHSREFSKQYPKIAGQLMMAGEMVEDPHVERLIQSFALLNARISKRLDDDYPEFTEALLEVLYPHYLRPFPSCSIVKMDCAQAASQLTEVSRVPRNTELSTRSVKGVVCKFRSVYEVVVAPVALSSAVFHPIITAPEAIRLPVDASSSISITLDLTNDQVSFHSIKLPPLNVFLEGESSFTASLMDVLMMNVVGSYVELDHDGKWSPLEATPLIEVGFTHEEAMFPFAPRSHPAYRLLTEYFAFPEKFNFVALDIPNVIKHIPSRSRKITLHFALSGIRSDSTRSRLLSGLSAKNMLLGCTPVINLFQQRGEPIRLTHQTDRYSVLADARRAFAYEIYSIDQVQLVRQTPQGESIQSFHPFYSLKHHESSDAPRHYWVAHQDAQLANKSPGYETEISIVDMDFNPVAAEHQTLSLGLTCTNRDLPASLAYGLPDGDLFLEGGANIRTIRFLRKPSPSYRFDRTKGAHWRLISHLSMNHLSISNGGLEAIKEIFQLYDLPRAASTQRVISGLTQLEVKPCQAWLPGDPFACLVRGMEFRLSIEEASFVGSGIHVFATVFSRFLGLYVHANSFTKLVIVASKTGEVLLECQPRSGDLTIA